MLVARPILAVGGAAQSHSLASRRKPALALAGPAELLMVKPLTSAPLRFQLMNLQGRYHHTAAFGLKV